MKNQDQRILIQVLILIQILVLIQIQVLILVQITAEKMSSFW